MNKTKVFVYLVVPAVVTGILIAMYFSGNLVLQRLVSPKLPPLPPDSWREFGLLEFLQVLLLLGSAVVACAGLRGKRARLERAFAALMLAGTSFVFLEEIDYGAHMRAYLSSEQDFQWFVPQAEWSPELVAQIDWLSEPVNIHNQPGLNKWFKRIADLVIFGLFVIVPLVALRVKRPLLARFAPDKYCILTVIAMVILRYVVHTLGDLDIAAVGAAQALGAPPRELGSITKNLSEFRELVFFYLVFVYVTDIVLVRRTAEEGIGPPEGRMTKGLRI